MELRPRKHMHCPAPCPHCGRVVHLLVAHPDTVTLHVHNAPGCNATLHYRCWLGTGSLLPLHEFIDPETVQWNGKPISHLAAARYPSPPDWQFHHRTRADRR